MDRRVVALGAARLADSFGNALLIVVLPLYVASSAVSGDQFGLTAATVTGVVLAAFGVFDSLVQPVAGRWSDRLGRRRAFALAGLVLLAVSNAAFAFTHTYVALLAVRIVQGVGVGVTVVASVALIDEYSTGATRGVHFGVFNALRLVGFGAGPLAAGVLVAHGPYRLLGRSVTGFTASFDVAAAAAVLGFAVVLALVRDPHRTSAAAASDLELRVFADGGLDPVFALGCATFFVAAGIALFATIQPTIDARLDQGPQVFALQFAGFVATFVVTQPVVGRLSDARGRRAFIVAGLLVTVPTLALQGVASTSLGLGVLRALQGVGAAMAFGPALALAGDLADEGASGTTLSVLTTAFGLGAGVGPVAAGPLLALGFAAPFLFGAALAAVGAVVVRTQVPRRSPDVR